MKTLNWKKLFSLFLASAMACSMVACDFLNSNEESSGKSDSETSTPTTSEAPATRTNDELFADVKAAAEATKAYDGAVTLLAGMYMEQQESDESEEDGLYGYSVAMEGKASYDKQTNLFYTNSSNTYDYNGEKQTSVYTEKAFVENSNFYLYEKSSQIPADEWSDYESYTKTSPQSISSEIESPNEEFFTLIDEVLGGTLLADSYTELVSAYDTVVPVALQNTIATGDPAFDINPEEGNTLDLEPTITITEEEEGEITLSFLIDVDYTNTYEDVSTTNKLLVTRAISVKDGKISAISVGVQLQANNVAPSEDGSETTTEITQITNITMSYEVDYAFDQAGYDAIAVTLPSEDEIAKETYDYSKDIVVMFGDLPYSTYISSYAEEPTAADALAGLAETIEFNFATSDWSTGEYVEIKTLSIEGLYLDKEFTQPLNPETITDEEYFALETVYAKYTLTDGYFIYYETSEFNIDLSKPFLITLGTSTEEYYGYLNVDSVENYEEGYSFSNSENQTVYVNGEQVTEEFFMPESGETYVITYKATLTDENFTLSYLLWIMNIIG